MVAWMIVCAVHVSGAKRLLNHKQEVIGVLDRTEMDNFAGIFMAFLKHGKTDDPKGMLGSEAFCELLRFIYVLCL